MTDILTRGVPAETRNALNMLASSLGISPNTLRIWIFEEAANPYSEFVTAVKDRAYEVEQAKSKQLFLKTPGQVPTPRSRTRPMHGGL